jgi:hypothetical protein
MDEKFIKITNSAYKVLEFLPEADPIKNKAKEKVLSIMESSVLVLGVEFTDTEFLPKTDQALRDIDIFLGYLKIVKERGWLDTINFLILEKEYKVIEVELIRLRSKYSTKNNQIQKEIATSPFGAPRNDGESTEKIEKKIEIEFTERQKKILEIIQKNEKTQVSDIIKVLPQVTKRTIRRDMDELLKLGMVLRIGEFNQIFYKFVENRLGHNDKLENTNRTIILS